jgi:NarL family two-component system response regulator LiaR
MSELIQVMIVDDHVLVRDGLKALITTFSEMRVVGVAANGAEAITIAHQLAEKSQVDVILMDLVMPVMDGIAAIEVIHHDLPQVRILALTSFAEDQKILAAVRAGAFGYLLKDSTSQELIQAIQNVFHGEPVLQSGIAGKLVKGITSRRNDQALERELTEREVAILKLVAQGLTNLDIANFLVISEQTVRTHVSNILSKLHLANRTQAALFALRKGLASIQDQPGRNPGGGTPSEDA